ncbi:MAG: PQQ-binding-like beta-propeller repeat protein [Leptospiraceae bacterium]|nr:PQQ-binding-like beta-propeller repeat protein [Leptospiraceae bacterium]MDW7975683.1 PQQ-binding-like beta-propeller repeat protein [Leptospiraceae bacterium]
MEKTQVSTLSERDFLQAMKAISSILFLLLIVNCSKQYNWIEYRGHQGSGYTSEHIFPPLGLKWKIKIQEERMRAKRAFNPPIVIDDVIYFGSPDGNFYAFDLNTGYMKWIFKTKGAVNSVPFADDQNVYFGSNDGNVYAVNRKTGEEVWSFYTGKTVQSLVLRYKDYIIFTSDTGATYFLDLDGKPVFQLPNPVWSHHTFQVQDDIVYWAPQGRRFGAYDINQRRFLWYVDVTAPYPLWYSFPAIDDENIYFSSSFYKGYEVEFNYYAVNRFTGELKWQYTDTYQHSLYYPVNEYTLFLDHVELLDYLAPTLWENLVIYTSGDTIVRAFDKNSGDLVWTKKLDFPSSSAPTVAGARIYFGVNGISEATDSGLFVQAPKLVCLSAKDGTTLWEYPTEGAVLNSPLISNGKIILGTDENVFYVLEEVFHFEIFPFLR